MDKKQETTEKPMPSAPQKQKWQKPTLRSLRAQDARLNVLIGADGTEHS